jgi:hypothetical protein
MASTMLSLLLFLTFLLRRTVIIPIATTLRDITKVFIPDSPLGMLTISFRGHLTPGTFFNRSEIHAPVS